MAQRVNRIAAGILRSGSHILLVQQQGKSDPLPSWAFPGGMVEDGELLTEALIREIGEETGLEVLQVGKLAYVTQMDNPIENTQSFAFVFWVAEWSGILKIDDPDGTILKAEFTPIKEAIRHLQENPWIAMAEPAVACLSGEEDPGKVWIYRLGKDGTEHRIDPI